MNYRKFGTLLVIVFFTFNSQADTLNKFKKCAVIEDNKERLSCYDGVLKILDSGLIDNKKNNVLKPITITAKTIEPKQENNSAIPQVNPKPKKKGKQDQFVKAQIIKPEGRVDVSFEQVLFTVKSVKKIIHNKLLITFKNGQVWKQSDSGYLKLSSGDHVKLIKGKRDVIYLKKEGKNKRIEVKRKE
jgi:hypothetical protein